MHNPADTLSATEARYLALAAQGFGARRATTVGDVLDRLHVLQIDSVNVFSRSHYMPAFSRLGTYNRDRLDETLWRGGDYTEYWAHEAAVIPVADRPLFTWRMHDFRNRFHRDGRHEALKSTAAQVLTQLQNEGPQLLRELETHPRSNRGPWWDWSDTKRAVEMLFATGEVVSAGREGFMRTYALAEHVLPASATAVVDRDTAQRTLIEQAAVSLGVATLADLADYHRMKTSAARHAVTTLAAEGILIPVTVEGWVDTRGKPLGAWIHRDADDPGRVLPDALLTPFDPLCWFRPRAERMFDFHYRIEIYTPKAKRQYGYYCLPLMVGGKLVGRIDLKADRAAQTLLVQASWQEPGAPARTARVAERLLTRAASWQGLDRVTWTGVGNLRLGFPA